MKCSPPREACPKAKAAARKALEIDETLAEAHAALGWTHLTCDWDWEGSEREFKRALEIDPNYATARQWHGEYLATMGRLEDSIAERRRGRKDEPLSLIIGATLGRILYLAGHYEQAIEELRKTLDLDPNFLEPHLYLGWIYEQKGMLPQAIEELQLALSLSGGHPRFLGSLGHAYAISGQRRMAEESLVRLREQSKQRYVAPYDLAVIYAGLKDRDQTWKYLEMAYEDHSYAIILLRADPRFAHFRSDSRYEDLLRRMHLVR
jgi:tetratricopeptide (TPR) repeat protein